MESLFTSSFIGIPLPAAFQSEFESALTDLKALSGHFDTVNRHTPHITLYYLDRQPLENLTAIAEMLHSHLPLLHEAEVTIHGMGLFSPHSPRVVFLEAAYPSALKEFHRRISAEMPGFQVAKADSPFHPHLTLARLRTKKAREVFANKRHRIEERLSAIDWPFKLTEVVVYGVAPASSSEGQKRVITLEIGAV